MMPQSGIAHLSQRSDLSAPALRQTCKTVRTKNEVELMQPDKREPVP